MPCCVLSMLWEVLGGREMTFIDNQVFGIPWHPHPEP